jgi:hypothetical protein
VNIINGKTGDCEWIWAQLFYRKNELKFILKLEPISKIRLGFRVRRGTVKKQSPAESGMSNTF